MSVQQRLEAGIEERDWDAVKAAVEDGADINAPHPGFRFNASCLLFAIHFGAPLDVLQWLWEQPSTDFRAVNSNGWTAVHYACWSPETGVSMSHSTAMLRWLVATVGLDALQCGTDEYGNQPLHFAAAYCNLEAVRFLVEDCGADANARNGYNDTPLMYAVKPYCHSERSTGYDVVGYLTVTCGVDTTVEATFVRGGGGGVYGCLLSYTVL